MKLLIMQFSPAPCHFFDQNSLLNTVFSNTFILCPEIFPKILFLSLDLKRGRHRNKYRILVERLDRNH
jgi:hypothetical protein